MEMQERKSLNFEPLRPIHADLVNLGGYAEHYVHADPESALVKLRSFAERMVDYLYNRLRLPRSPQSNFIDLLNNSSLAMVADSLVLDKRTHSANSATAPHTAKRSPWRTVCAP